MTQHTDTYAMLYLLHRGRTIRAVWRNLIARDFDFTDIQQPIIQAVEQWPWPPRPIENSLDWWRAEGVAIDIITHRYLATHTPPSQWWMAL